MKTEQDAGWWCPRGVWTALLLAALLGHGAAVAESGVPSFHIETITVETQRLSPEIVLSESLLREGEEYSEDELREAVHRISRLPFVLRAEFSLRKGSERDRYELVVRVFETRRWFFQTDLTFALEDPIERFRFDSDFSDRNRAFGDDLDALVGRRFALGGRSLLFATFGSDEGTFAIGFQRYNLWDRNILFSISLGGDEEIGDVSTSEFSLAGRAQLGIPIRGNHAIRLLLGWREFESKFTFGDFDSEERQAEIAWILNSLDDPVLPREGSLFEAGLTWVDVESHSRFFLPDGLPASSDSSDRGRGVIVGASRHWPLAENQSVSAGLRGFFSELSDGDQFRDLEATVGHQIFLLRNLELEKWRELRLETQISGLRREYSLTRRDLGIPDVTQDDWSASVGLVYRNGWGLFRFAVNYYERDIN
jgi:hypothetical protein